MHNLLIESKVIAGENVTVIWIWNRTEDGDFLFQSSILRNRPSPELPYMNNTEQFKDLKL